MLEKQNIQLKNITITMIWCMVLKLIKQYERNLERGIPGSNHKI